MKKHAIIPIFVPHLGCPHDCVFCNQRSITAREEAPDAAKLRDTAESWLSTLGFLPPSEIEMAFYGGSFTGLALDEQNYYLDIAAEYKAEGRIGKIHLSTRPDYIDERILDNLKAHSVDTVELGVQSFDEEVLRLSERGHTASDAVRAAGLIKAYGMELGIQLMIGLPGDSLEKCVYSAKKAAALSPALARLYPTVVLKGTRLYEDYLSGKYIAPTKDEMLLRTKEMYKILDDAGIYIMRVGLKSTELISEGSDAVASGYHPAYRQLIEDAIARERIDEMLSTIEYANKEMRQSVTLYANRYSYGNLFGHKGENRRYFKERYPLLDFSFAKDDELKNNRYRLEYQNA